MLLRALVRNHAVVGLEFMQAGSIVLLVETEEERREVKAAVERLEMERRSIFAVEIKP